MAADLVILAGEAVYPKDHKAGMRVPKGGSSCAVCEYLKGPHECGNPHFIEWNDGPNFKPPSDEFCCDWFEAADKEIQAGGPGSGRHKGENHFIFVQHPERGTHFQFVNDKNWNDESSEAATKYRDHLPFMEKLGMPTSGNAYDRITRGFGSADPVEKKVHVTLAGGERHDDYSPEDVVKGLQKQYPGYDVHHWNMPSRRRERWDNLSASEDPLAWYGVDLDSTIAYYDKFRGMKHIGKPIMGQALARVKQWLREGKTVKIFTARARSKVAVAAIQRFCEKVFGKKLEVTDRKDEHMVQGLDDRMTGVEPNTGKIIESAGTHEGALKGWDTRGRGKHESDDKVMGWKHGQSGQMSLNGIPFHTVKPPTKDYMDAFKLIDPSLKEPPVPEIPEGKHLAAGIIMEEPDGRIWTVTPMNYYGGYVNTFPKGTVNDGESPQEAAVREVHEETGLLAKITGFAGDINRTTSVTRYYFGQRVGGAPWDSDRETYRVNLLPADKHLADRLRDAEGYKTADQTLLNMHKEVPDKADNILDKKIGQATGTNPGGLYKGADGITRYVKFYGKPEQAYGEVIANNVYRDLGLGAPKSEAFTSLGKPSVANELLPGKQLNQVPLTKDVANEILRGFAADVLTINWDAVGLQHDNVLVDGDKVHRIDNGGTFLMRAQGGFKPEGLLHGVGELQSLFNPKINPAYSKVANAAGVKSYQDVPEFKKQVDAIVALEKKVGGWDKYVKEKAPDASPVLQNEITKILDARTEGLRDAVHIKKIESAALWNGIQIVGFTGPEEEAIRSSLSRIPPELLENVYVIQSAKELNAKHGRYIPTEKKILFNPGNLILRQRFGGGENAIRHDILTLVHEVGHSLYETLTPAEKQSWLNLSGWKEGWSDGQAPAYVERRPGWEPHTSEWTHKAGVKFPRYYSERNPNEHFSDCFAYFLLNKGYKLADNVREFFENYVSNHVHRYPQTLIQSPIKAAVTELIAAFVTGMADAVHEEFNERQYGSVHKRREEIRAGHRNGQGVSRIGLRDAKLQRVGGHQQRQNNLQAYGTSEGVTKSWDTRGRGRHPHPKADLYKKLFEEKELGLKPVPKVTYPEDVSPSKPSFPNANYTYGQPTEKKKYKPGEKQKEKVEKFLSGDIKPSKSGKVSILGGIWGGNAAPVVVYKTMMTGEWHTIASLIQNADQDVISKWNKDHQEALAKGDTKFWSVKDRIESGLKRVTKAGKDFGQWTMEQRISPTTGYQEYKLVMGLVHDQAKGQEGITQDVQHKALQAIQKMVNNKGLDNTVSKQAMTDYLSSVGVKNVSALTSAVGDWTGSAQSIGATKLKMIAAEYYGNDWNKEYANHNMTKFPGYDDLKKQLLAIKALSNEYMKAAGFSTFYRGIKLTNSPQLLENIKAAKAKGEAVPVPLNSLSGFSTKASTASSFGGSGIVVRQNVKPEEVWVASSALPHMFGSFAHGEKEYLIGSKSNTVSYIKPEDVWIKGEKNPPDWVVDYLKTKYKDKFDPSKAGMV